jgi:hypothetical protein
MRGLCCAEPNATPTPRREPNRTEKDMAPKETEPKDETATERAARYERIGKASAKTIKNMFAGTALADKLRAKGYTWVPKSKDPPKEGN